jgi:electron transfer flavoprotein alpha subunit
VLTVRGTAFEKAAAEGGSGTVEAVGTTGDQGLSSFVGAEIAASERPELTSAKIIVSGGRALGSSEQFHALIDPLPTSSAPASAPAAPQSTRAMRQRYQVGQTGKIVAPEVYSRSASPARSSISRA